MLSGGVVALIVTVFAVVAVLGERQLFGSIGVKDSRPRVENKRVASGRSSLVRREVDETDEVNDNVQIYEG